ncbi:MAG: GntR family transcriptional regulator [Rubrivivax sp.]|nr:GntR family transcriptional regulator [Rubrivivax sp.]
MRPLVAAAPVRRAALRLPALGVGARAVGPAAGPGAAADAEVAPGSGPLYRRAKRALLQVIEQGACAPGTALPSEAELARTLGVSIGTLRRAVDELVADHVLVRHQGRGTFVATHDAERFLFQFFHVERADGRRESPQVELLAFHRQRLDDADAAEALRLREGEAVLVVENRLTLQGRPVVHDRLVLPAALFRGLTEKRLAERPGTIYQLYQSEFAITVLRAAERARAIAADRSAARVLGVPVGAPVMQVRRTALTFGDKPVEYRVSVVNTARHDYVHVLSRPSRGN